MSGERWDWWNDAAEMDADLHADPSDRYDDRPSKAELIEDWIADHTQDKGAE